MSREMTSSERFAENIRLVVAQGGVFGGADGAAAESGGGSEGAPPTPPPSSGGSSEAPAPAPDGGSEDVVQDIFEAVDGAGSEPKFGEEELGTRHRPSKTSTQRAEAGEVLKEGEVGDDPSQQDTSQQEPQPNTLEAFIQQELGEGSSGEEQTSEQTEEDTSEESRSDKRIQQLVNQTREAQREAQTANQQLQQAGQAFQQMQQQMQQMQTQNAELAGKLSALMQGQTQEQDPAAWAEEQLLNKATEKLSPQMQEAIKPLQQKLEQQEQYLQQMHQQRQQAERQQKINENKQRYSHQAEQAVRDVVLKGIPEEAHDEMKDALVEQTLGTAWAHRTDPVNAAKMVRERHLRFGLHFIRAYMRNQNQQREQKTANAPPPPGPKGRTNTGGGQDSYEPSWEKLQENDMNYLDWEMQGRPHLG